MAGQDRMWRQVARWMLLLACLPGLAMSEPPQGAQARPDPMPGDFRIDKGRVDRGTYAGWRLFHSACYGCHGVGGVGTELAPNLVLSIKSMTPRAFATKVLTSYRFARPAETDAADDPQATLDVLIEQVMRRERIAAGQIPMPAWDDNPRVAAHVLDLYAYLSARADGKLGPGKPLPVQRR